MQTNKTFPHVTHSRDASILACELRAESHESLACHAANLAVEVARLRAALTDISGGGHWQGECVRRARIALDA